MTNKRPTLTDHDHYCTNCGNAMSALEVRGQGKKVCTDCDKLPDMSMYEAQTRFFAINERLIMEIKNTMKACDTARRELERLKV